MKRTEWVLIDTETTGLGSDDWVIEVCIQQMLGWRPVGASRSWLINAPKSVGSRAFSVHGISNDMLERLGEEPRKAHDSILDFIDGRPFGAFNLPFDRRMLSADWNRLKVAKNRRPLDALCALRLARLFIPDSSGYRLAHLADHLKLRNKPKHRAKHDVKATAEMLSRCVGMRAGDRTFKEIKLLCEMPIGRARSVIAD
jgi:DNA polymerase III epsilon subunit-like protein